MHGAVLYVCPLDVTTFPVRSADETGMALIDTLGFNKYANNGCGDIVGSEKVIILTDECYMLTVQQIKETVAGYFKDKPVKEVYLFGSYARGEAKEDSDIDLGIVMDDTRMNLWQYAGMALGLEESLNKRIDLVEINLMHSWVKRNFEKDKMEIYHA